ncbi:hypothetical protein CR983_01645 [Candidatus Saccharibacteria bacterium]|nr:MAG: hypothetical protein CR983_01645 [Candidatus Saccharibacteria bacterium]
MLRTVLQAVIPHYCCSCGGLGSVLCESCKYDIISEYTDRCVQCQRPVAAGRCTICKVPYERAWAAGLRRDALDRLVSTSKFDSVRAGCDMQAALLDQVLPELPERSVVVPVPTIARHIRRRGYGHAERIADRFARRRGVVSARLVKRRAQHVQHGSSRRERQRQAARSYSVADRLDPSTTYIIVDDVFTTGYTVRYVAQQLRAAGAKHVWVAVTSRQPTGIDVL